MTAPPQPFDLECLKRALDALPRGESAAASLDALVRDRLDELPLPGYGATRLRWQALAAVAAHDLSLAKLYEGHTDALAILAELHASELAPAGSTWGTWAAEAPNARATIGCIGAHDASLDGAKAWCSGAGTASHALLTAWGPDGSGPQLVATALDQAGISVSREAWQAVGMQQSASFDVRFDAAAATLVGAPGAYLSRPGFWHGGAGIAACWYGGAVGLARSLHRAAVATTVAREGDFRRAALGRVDVAMQATAALLHACAGWIDAHPSADARVVALRARLAAERAATTVLDEVGRALGAAPFCRDARFARAAADLPVFIRQSHAERDEAALGELVMHEADPWTL